MTTKDPYRVQTQLEGRFTLGNVGYGKLRRLALRCPQVLWDARIGEKLAKITTLEEMELPDGETTIEEGFWEALCEHGENGGVKLKRLIAPRISMSFLNYLQSYEGLEWLEFDCFYAPVSTDDNPRSLMDPFFKKALPKHRGTLKVLALCGRVAHRVGWRMTESDLEAILACEELAMLTIPGRQPFIEAVSKLSLTD